MHIDVLEKRWIQISIALMAAFAVLIGVAAFAWGVQVPTLERRVDPARLKDDPIWSNPGVREVVPGKHYEVYMIAKVWQFEPREIQVPVGARVTFYVTSADVQHAFKIVGTSVSMQVLPGYVGKVSYTFQEPGEYSFICTEYCGIGHAAMYGVIKVTESK